MKILKLLTLLISVLCCVNLSNAQDVIVKKDNSTILSKVIKISPTEIEYKKWSNQDGPTYTINISDVSSINYENGERDIFNVQMDDSEVTKHMKRIGRNLALDHVVLKNEEVQKLLDADDYETYLSARRQVDAGTLFTVIFVGSLCWDLMYAFAIIVNADDTNINSWVNRFLIGCVVTDISCPLMCVFNGIGKGRLNWLADKYNRQHRDYSFNISPSLMRYNTPQSQNNYGLGMTLSLNF